jgi:phosphatidylserine/phosphatidylglycerophosphate/cardiolipin synthase-like enzyme
MPAVYPIARGWHRRLAELVNSASRELIICTPFVGRVGTRVVIDNLSPAFARSGSVSFITSLSIANVCSLATDPAAIKDLSDAVSTSRLTHLPGLHAKVYVSDERHAIVTSGNLTSGGLFRNIEYGIDVTDSVLVRRIRDDLRAFAELGAVVPYDRLAGYCETLDAFRPALQQARLAADAAISAEFRNSLTQIEDDLIQLRLAGGPIHTVFSRTIEYLLRTHGPLPTTEIHPLICSLHPDLCDDTVDRIIDGKRFGKKWKHAARSAQQQLKRRGVIRYENGRWRSV